ncbi:hypothetical protein A3742_10650 [Oleiphilus sp. HI0071]|uniref:Mpo1 family 2-hydroxy fatty acid dioxygenase n=1 Tax=unclassified Oleiphilus TaxID=2631174 RepID=UPI0007C3267E|nr:MULTISPECIES: Mpo1-like protein [unclassified Oleiphilus]KZY60778.1 hypothetical protein A3737_22925 [Oleiphilus sp. HI0065]KZY81905.1 hypothetical protein A3742_10650 [Oleiphilus sp. HI0071]KZY91677.1 hypothetical protein A3744_15050 [Oleiphilus sp. HI0073]KZZ49392.1 hypothetical protein A3760_21525 [Oleiphilus sp. HI0122]KZZ65707.1 hypothetical protein A3765_05650 [Oleiphilus sp. HI0130]KZZ78222.1 hypothetical protein A3767_13415 [Oleiphilus sp. HI0133]
MKTLTDQLSMYAKYHRDPRNIATHFIGIPMIVFAITVLLARPEFVLFGFALTPSHLLVCAASVYYLMLSVPLAVLMTALFSVCLYFSQGIAASSTAVWLAWGVGLFVVGWVFQFVGHFYEGKKPAFVDDLSGLLIGPLFVVCEFLFMIGVMSGTKKVVEAEAGVVEHQTGPQSKAQHN